MSNDTAPKTNTSNDDAAPKTNTSNDDTAEEVPTEEGEPNFGEPVGVDPTMIHKPATIHRQVINPA